MPKTDAPDNTAARVALWRALHVLADPPPHVLHDEIGLQLLAPEAGWRDRPDMHAQRMSRSRASIVARARFIEDLVEACAAQGVLQYVLLGAGLDTFAQRRPELASRLQVFEVDQAETQAWKRGRLLALGYPIPDWLHLAPVDFEAEQSWLEQITRAGFERQRPAVVASSGVAMYLSREAVGDMLRQVASLAPGSTFAMSFMLPIDRVAPEERPSIEAAAKGARAAGTPFLSFFSGEELIALAREAGFAEVERVSAEQLADRYFGGRTDGLRPSSAEELLVART